MRVVEVDEVELLRFQQALEDRREPAVSAVPGGTPEDEPHALGEQRIHGTGPLDDVQSALEHAAQRLPVFAFARPGEHGGVERLVERAKRGERPESAPRIGGQRYAGQQGENAAAGWRRAGCVQSVPPCGTVRMLSGEHTSKALVRPSGAHDG